MPRKKEKKNTQLGPKTQCCHKYMYFFSLYASEVDNSKVRKGRWSQKSSRDLKTNTFVFPTTTGTNLAEHILHLAISKLILLSLSLTKLPHTLALPVKRCWKSKNFIKTHKTVQNSVEFKEFIQTKKRSKSGPQIALPYLTNSAF